jgi:hypothetical protein
MSFMDSALKKFRATCRLLSRISVGSPSRTKAASARLSVSVTNQVIVLLQLTLQQSAILWRNCVGISSRILLRMTFQVRVHWDFYYATQLIVLPGRQALYSCRRAGDLDFRRLLSASKTFRSSRQLGCSLPKYSCLVLVVDGDHHRKLSICRRVNCLLQHKHKIQWSAKTCFFALQT